MFWWSHRFNISLEFLWLKSKNQITLFYTYARTWYTELEIFIWKASKSRQRRKHFISVDMEIMEHNSYEYKQFSIIKKQFSFLVPEIAKDKPSVNWRLPLHALSIRLANKCKRSLKNLQISIRHYGMYLE